MPHNLDLILTLTGGLGAALIFGFLAQKLRLSPIVGYLLAGVAVGPFTPGFVAHRGLAEQLAEIGVILLMFGVGLHFHVKELLAVRRVALPGALAQIGAATAVSMLVAHLAGWSIGAGIVFGLAVSVASTVVLLRVLADYGALHTPSGHVAVGWLVVEDIFTVFVLVMLPLFAGDHAQGTPTEVALSMGWAIVKIGALIAFTLIVGQRVIPALLSYVSKTGSRELFTLTVLVLALGIAVGSAKLFGASMALGAFLAGMVVGQSDFSARAASEALPMRDAFAVLFFVSMGMLFDPAQLIPNLGLIAATIAIVLVCKPLVAFLVVILLRRPVAMAVTVSVALAQIGEFSFMLAALGRELGVLPASATQVLVVTAIVSVTANAILFRLVAPASRWLSARLERRGPKLADALPEVSQEDRELVVVVVGYGPVGRTVTRLLRDNGFIPTVIEMNLETVQQLNREGRRAVYGDASQREILERAGIATASSLVYAASGTPPEATVAIAKELNPTLLVLARATYISEMHALSKMGNVVVTAEVEVALSMTERLLERIGATREQLDRERDRVRSELANA